RAREHHPSPHPRAPRQAPLHRGHGESRDSRDLRDRGARRHAARGPYRGGGTARGHPGIRQSDRSPLHSRRARYELTARLISEITRGGMEMERSKVNIAVGIFVVMGVLALAYLSI